MAIKKRKKSTGKKRVLSAAQKAALARGRKKAAANRKKKSTVRKPAVKKRRASVKRRKSPVSRSSEPLVIIHQGEKTMAKKRRRSSTAKKTTCRRRRSSGRYMSGFGIGNKSKKIQSMLTSTAIGTASAIGGTILLAKLPVTNTKVKSALPLIGGIIVGIMAKGKNAAVMSQVSTGLMIAGGLSIVKQFAPQFSLAGEREMYQQNSMLGVSTDLLGINTDVVDDYSTDLSQY
jgi:hypothetical protein